MNDSKIIEKEHLKNKEKKEKLKKKRENSNDLLINKKEIKKSFINYFDLIISIILMVFSVIIYSYINIIHLALSFYLIYSTLLIKNLKLFSYKKYFIIFIIILDIIYIIAKSLILGFKEKIISNEKLKNLVLIFLICKKEKNENGEEIFTQIKNIIITDYILISIILFILIIYLCYINFSIKLFSQIIPKNLRALNSINKYKKNLLSFGFYLICIGASIRPTSIGLIYLIVVLIHFGTLIFSINLHRLSKKLISIIFLFLIPIYVIYNYFFNCPLIDKYKEKDFIKYLGIMYYYDDINGKLYKFKILNIFPIFFYLVGFCLINLYLKCIYCEEENKFNEFQLNDIQNQNLDNNDKKDEITYNNDINNDNDFNNIENNYNIYKNEDYNEKNNSLNDIIGSINDEPNLSYISSNNILITNSSKNESLLVKNSENKNNQNIRSILYIDIDTGLISFLEESKNLAWHQKVRLYIVKYFYTPGFCLHLSRIGIIIWIILYSHYFSVILIIWLFISIKYSKTLCFLYFSKFLLLPILFLIYAVYYINNIDFNKKDDNNNKKSINFFEGDEYKNDFELFYNMAIRFTIISIFVLYIHTQNIFNIYYKKNKVFLENKRKIIKEEIQNRLKDTKYVLEPIEIFFKFFFTLNDILLVIFLYLSITQSINIFNEFMLLFLILMIIFRHSINKFYYCILIFMNIIFLLKYIFYFYKDSLNDNNKNDDSNDDEIISLFFYENLRHCNIHYYWISYYLLFIEYINQTSQLFTLCKMKTFSIYVLIEKNLKIHPEIKFLLTTLFDFIFGIYMWLLIPIFLYILLMKENNILFLIQLVITFFVYYKFIKIVGNTFKNLENIFLYTYLLMLCSIFNFLTVYIIQILNKKPLSNWINLKSKDKKMFGYIGFFIFEDNYTKNFLPYIFNFITCIALHIEINRQVKLNTNEIKEKYKNENKKNIKSILQQSFSIEKYNKQIYIILYYILHYYWIIIFIVITILSIYWMISISMAIELILFLYYVLKSFYGYYKILNFNLKQSNLKNLLKLYKKEKYEHFKITSKYQLNYFNLLWNFTFLFIFISYLSNIFMKYLNENNKENSTKKLSGILYFLGFYTKQENYFYYSYGYFLIILLFAFRAYFLSKFAEIKLKEGLKQKIFNKNNNIDENYLNGNNKNNKFDLYLNDSEFEFGSNISNLMNINNLNEDLDDENKKIKRKGSFEYNKNFNPLFNNFYGNELNFNNSIDYNEINLNNKRKKYKRNSSIIIENIKNNDSKMKMKHKNSFFIPNSSLDDSQILKKKIANEKLISYSLNNQITIKRILELFIIALILISATIKINIYSFILLLVVILTYHRKLLSTKIIFNISLLILILFILQYILFVSNLSYEINPFKDEEVLIEVNNVFNIPWYNKYFGKRWAIFFGVGVVRYQVESLWMDSIILIFLYFYLEFFSFNIYENSEKEDSIQDICFKYNEKFKQLKTLTKKQYNSFCKAMKISYELDLKNNLNRYNKNNYNNDSFFEDKKDYLEEDNSKYKNDNSNLFSRINIKSIKLNFYKNIMSSKLNSKKKKNNLKIYKLFRTYFYLSFPYIFLILVLLISSLNKGLITIGYNIFSIYYIYKTHAFLKGRTWTFHLSIISFLKPYLFMDILFQFIFQIPFDVFKQNSEVLNKYFKNFGFINLCNYTNPEDFLNVDELFHMTLKVLCYFLILIQEMIYNSHDFKRFILKYHYEYMQKAYIKGKFHGFLFNNHRIKLMKDRMEEQNEINGTLKNIEKMITKWNNKLNNKKFLEINFSRKDSNDEEEEIIYKKDNKLTINKLLRKQWYIRLALGIYESSRYIDNEHLKDSKCIEMILKGSCYMYSELENLIYKFEKENKEKYKKLIELEEKIKKELDKEDDNFNEDNNNENKNKLKIDNKENNNLIKNDEKDDEDIIIEDENLSIKIDNKNNNNFYNKNQIISKNFQLINDEDSNNNLKIKQNNNNIQNEKIEINTNNNKFEKNKSSYLDSKNIMYDKNSFLSSDYYDFKNKIRMDFFKNYCSKYKIFTLILKYVIKYLEENFEYVCYFFMFLNHLFNANLISIFYVLAFFLFGITQYPRPEKFFWKICLIYTTLIIFVKFFIQLNIIESEIFDKTNIMYKRIGLLKISDENFFYDFFFYIIFDFILLCIFLINQFMLIRKGLWYLTEGDYENIFQANDRIEKYQNLNINKEKLTLNEILDIIGNPKQNIKNNICKRISFFYSKNFTKIRNEKPGMDFYLNYTIFLTFILIYVIFCYTNMEKDSLVYNVNSFKVKKFSGKMVIFAFIHVFILVFDRFIYLKNSRKMKKTEFKIYDENGNNVTNNFIKYSNNEIKKLYHKNNLNNLYKNYNIVSFQYEGSNLGLILKFLLQIISVLFIHIFIFYYLPYIGNKNATIENIPTKNLYILFFYLLYTFYFIFSGLQIKYGLSDLRKSSSLMQGSNIYHSIIFKCYRKVPFLFELKNFIDWTFTSTALDIWKWLKLEEINSLLFLNKCLAKSYMGRRVGTKVTVLKKLLLGASLFLALLGLIFGPLILFSTLNPSNIANKILGGEISVEFSIKFNQNEKEEKEDENIDYNYMYNLTLFSTNNLKIDNFNKNSYDNYSKYIQNQSLYDIKVYTDSYLYTQVQNITFQGYGEFNWEISDNFMNKLKNAFNKTYKKCNLYLKYHFKKEYSDKNDYNAYQTYELNCSDFETLLYDNKTNSKNFSDFYSPFLKIQSDSIPEKINDYPVEINLTKHINNNNSYWTFDSLNQLKNESYDEGIYFITFTDLYSKITFGYDVLTFYITFIYFAGTLIRQLYLGQAERVIYTEMVNPNKLINVCEGIRISRIKKDFVQEDRLYYLLIDLMRSPEIVKSITKSSLVYIQKNNILLDKNIKNKDTKKEEIYLRTEND